jgi:uncharacterized membrane protein
MMIPKHRLDGLTDAVFGVAMTLLVIDLRLPESFFPHGAGELLRAVSDLWAQFLAYAISFFVLGRQWMALAKLAARTDPVTDRVAVWSLVHLFLVACIPFSTMLVGRYGEFAPAIWVYAANIIVAALVMLRLMALADQPADPGDEYSWRGALIALIVVALISVVVSTIDPSRAMWAYLLLVLTPLLQKWRARAKA